MSYHKLPSPLVAPQVAVGAIVIKDKKILLVKRTNDPGREYWAISGGSVELGETLQEAAERDKRRDWIDCYSKRPPTRLT